MSAQMAPIAAEKASALTRGRRRRSVRYWCVVAVLSAALLGLVAAGLLVGEERYSPAEVIAVLCGQRVPGASFVIGELRLPRVAVGLLAGLAFGAAGSASQTLLRNQLASPDIIGITAGASASAVFAILVLGLDGAVVSAISVVFGLLTATVIFLLAGRGARMGSRLILIGIGIGAMLTSVINYLQLKATSAEVGASLRWLSGSLNSATREQIPPLAIAVFAVVPVLVALNRSMRSLQLGDIAAIGLGVRVDPTRFLIVICMVALAAFAASATGPIAFVSFLAGPISVRLTGTGESSPIIPAALTGAALVLGADLLAQNALPYSYPVGVVTGIVGAPYLLLQIIRLNAKGTAA